MSESGPLTLVAEVVRSSRYPGWLTLRLPSTRSCPQGGDVREELTAKYRIGDRVALRLVYRPPEAVYDPGRPPVGSMDMGKRDVKFAETRQEQTDSIPLEELAARMGVKP